MPWENSDPLATAMGSAAAFLGGQQQAKDRARQSKLDDIQQQQSAAALAATQARTKYEQGRDAAADAKGSAADRLAGVGLEYPKNLEAKPDAPPIDQAKSLLRIANWYDEQGANGAAKEARTQAAAIMAASKTDAQTGAVVATTGLTGAKTTTEKERPALVKAQTANVKDLPKSRAEKRAEDLQLQQMREAQAMQRAAIASQAAWQRMMFHADHPASRGGGGGGGRGGGGRSGRSSESVGTEYQQLTPKGQQFYDMLSMTNNAATPGQALAALRQSSLPDADKALVSKMVTEKGASTVSPSSQSAQARIDARPPKADVAIESKIGGLPAGVQQVILKMAKQGVSTQAIATFVQQSPSLPDEVKAQAKAALGG